MPSSSATRSMAQTSIVREQSVGKVRLLPKDSLAKPQNGARLLDASVNYVIHSYSLMREAVHG